MKNKIITIGGITYLLSSIIIWFLGMFFSLEILKFVGLMFLASTFLPMPADTYILFISNQYIPLFIGIMGGLINSFAVIFEKIWLKKVLKTKYFKKISFLFGESKFTIYSNKFMFISLLISGFSFLPFEPFRLVAVIKDYSNKKYFLATFLGRGLRYFLIAYIGKELFKDEWLIYAIIISLAGFCWGIIKIIRKKLRS